MRDETETTISTTTGAINSLEGRRIWITGHKGMLGSALVRALDEEGAALLLASRAELDLRNQAATLAWMKKHRPEIIFHAGAKVGGILANSIAPAEFLLDNLMIQSNVICAAHQIGVEKLIFVASNCIYPEKSPQPISEDALLTRPLENNIRAYAIGKIAGLELCRAYNRQYGTNFITVIPPNLYGPGDNYHPENSHVVAGIMRRTHLAKHSNSRRLIVWGDGTPRREILYVDDLADAMKYVMRAPTLHDAYNIGYGLDLSIAEIATMIAGIVGFEGEIIYDTSKPNGTAAKLLDSRRVRYLGWRPRIAHADGLRQTYRDFTRRTAIECQSSFQNVAIG